MWAFTDSHMCRNLLFINPNIPDGDPKKLFFFSVSLNFDEITWEWLAFCSFVFVLFFGVLFGVFFKALIDYTIHLWDFQWAGCEFYTGITFKQVTLNHTKCPVSANSRVG